MNARTFTTATLFTAFAGVFAASAADSQLLSMVMPDAKVVAGVNVQQAMATPFGQYVLSLIAPQDQQIQSLATQIGFDPRRDVRELLVASTGAPAHAGLVLARARNDSKKSGFTYSVGTDQPDHAIGWYADRHDIQRCDLTVDLRETVEDGNRSAPLVHGEPCRFLGHATAGSART